MKRKHTEQAGRQQRTCQTANLHLFSTDGSCIQRAQAPVPVTWSDVYIQCTEHGVGGQRFYALGWVSGVSMLITKKDTS